MKYTWLKRLLLIVVVVVAANAVSRGLIVSFYYDLFESCLSFNADRTSFECQYGPQVLLNSLAGLGIIGALYALGYKTTRLLSRIAPVVIGFLYIALAMATWRVLVSLSPNFNLSAGPETFNDYVFVLFANVESLFIGLAIGLGYNLLLKVDTLAKPEKGRRAPRLKIKGFGKK